jgi:hypothetical protein
MTAKPSAKQDSRRNFDFGYCSGVGAPIPSVSNIFEGSALEPVFDTYIDDKTRADPNLDKPPPGINQSLP